MPGKSDSMQALRKQVAALGRSTTKLRADYDSLRKAHERLQGIVGEGAGLQSRLLEILDVVKQSDHETKVRVGAIEDMLKLANAKLYRLLAKKG